MSLRVAFDTSVTDFDRGGTKRYVDALLARLRERDDVDVIEVDMRSAWPWAARLPRRARILLHDLRWVPSGSVAAARDLGVDLWHGAGFKVPATDAIATSLTIHDDTPWDSPPTARLYNRVYMRAALRRAAPHLRGAITSTDLTARAIAERLPGLGPRIHVTPWGVDHDTFRVLAPAEAEAALARLGVEPPYVLMVSPYGPRKNQAKMMAALDQLPHGSELKLVIAGRNEQDLRCELPTIRLGQVDDNQLAALYNGAELLLYASLKEGFGLPVIEAMACGCPVVGSRGTVIEEIGGDAAELVDPRAEEAITAGVRAVLEDAGHRDEMRTAGLQNAARFTWERTADLTVAAWQQMT
ncbi:MAG: hypothetical protein QOE92_552 [Chloroflexota bacterium]|nr:hypothetical protein [Chloroflexota bacterium]